jgi:SRSO17 transposase
VTPLPRQCLEPATNACRRSSQTCSHAEDLNRQRVMRMIAEAMREDGVLVLDDTGFPKQERASVGVTRQDSESLGKVGKTMWR